jgi:hypothetical protein
VRLARSGKHKDEEESESRRLRNRKIEEVMSVMQAAAGGQKDEQG